MCWLWNPDPRKTPPFWNPAGLRWVLGPACCASIGEPVYCDWNCRDEGDGWILMEGLKDEEALIEGASEKPQS